MNIPWINSSLNDRLKYGQKTTGLTLAIECGFDIPQSFLLSGEIVKKISESSLDKKTSIELHKTFKSLYIKSTSKKIIVRSSSIYEGLNDAKFSGLFHTSHNVLSLQSLFRSIKKIYTSSFSEELNEYYDKNSISSIDTHMNVIVQEQIDYDIAGIAHISKEYINIELASKNFKDIASGVLAPEAIFSILYDIDRDLFNWSTEKNTLYISNDMKNILELSFKKIRNKLINENNNIVIEFCVKDLAFYILQLNKNYDYMSYSQISSGTLALSSLDHGNKLGLKAAAMIFFKRNKLFSKNAIILPPDENIKNINYILKKRINKLSPVTIRYSYGYALGLPRYFAEGITDAISFIKNTRCKKWTTIVHPQLIVKHSFELLIGINSTIIEHVPGMWESDNKLNPDVIVFSKKNIKYFRYSKDRIAKYSSYKGDKNKKICKCTFKKMKNWARKAYPIIENLREKFIDYLPINVRFIEEDDKTWQFLNIRNSSDIIIKSYEHENFFRVSSYSDFDNWDRVSPILLGLTTQRGEEHSVIKLAKKLQKLSCSIYVDFGMLSHPAMVLKEYGVNLTPSYLIGNNIDINSTYDVKEENIKIEESPLLRIVKEKQLINDKNFFVVHDKEPICPNHILIVSKNIFPSIADAPNSMKLIKLLNKIEKNIHINTSWLFWERGRASFCTSGFTCSHAHVHYLPLDHFDNSLLDELINTLKCTHHKTIQDALEVASQSTSEYFIFGTKELGFFLELPSNNVLKNKRFIRFFLESRRSYDK